MTHRLWAANPHQYGPGKVHIIDPEQPAQTVCGKIMSAFPGRPCDVGNATCQACINSMAKRPIRKAQEEESRRRWEVEAAAREAENAEWWRRYDAYLRTPEWKKKSTLVIQRAGGICEACRERPATQAHHTTYEHVFAEPLFELVATCKACHERIDAMDDAAREARRAHIAKLAGRDKP